MMQQPQEEADQGRKPHRTAMELQNLNRQIFPRHRLGSRVANKRTALLRTMSGICRRAIEASSPGETQRHGTEAKKKKKRKKQKKKSNVANLPVAHWVRGKALPRGNRRTPWKKAPNHCNHPPCEICGNRWQRFLFECSHGGVLKVRRHTPHIPHTHQHTHTNNSHTNDTPENFATDNQTRVLSFFSNATVFTTSACMLDSTHHTQHTTHHTHNTCTPPPPHDHTGHIDHCQAHLLVRAQRY